MGKLEPVHLSILRLASEKPFYGFPAGSNLWPLTVLDEEGIAADGELVDELLRAGLLVPVDFGEVVEGDRTTDPEFGPDLDFEHIIHITDAGRAVLEAHP